MKTTALGFSLYDRPEFTRRMMESLLAADSIHEYPVFFFVDGAAANDPGAIKRVAEVRKLAEEFPHKHKTVLTQPENVGVGINIYEGKRTMFEEHGYDQAIMGVDDVIYAPYLFDAAVVLHDALRGKVIEKHFTTDMWSKCYMTREEKITHLSEVKCEGGQMIYVLDKDVWDQQKDFVSEYLELFIYPNVGKYHRPYRVRNSGAIRRWLFDRLGKDLCPTWASSQDGVVRVAHLAKKIQCCATVVNHAINIGRHGEHTNEAVFKKLRFGEQDISNIDRDTVMEAVANPVLVGGLTTPMEDFPKASI